jgi:hypothetical protein
LKVNFPAWIQPLGAKDNLPKDKYFGNVPKANEDGGVYAG